MCIELYIIVDLLYYTHVHTVKACHGPRCGQALCVGIESIIMYMYIHNPRPL